MVLTTQVAFVSRVETSTSSDARISSPKTQVASTDIPVSSVDSQVVFMEKGVSTAKYDQHSNSIGSDIYTSHMGSLKSKSASPATTAESASVQMTKIVTSYPLVTMTKNSTEISKSDVMSASISVIVLLMIM